MTEKEFVQTTLDLINANPEFVYVQGDRPRCAYAADEEQLGCLFGQTLLKLGVSHETLQLYDGGLLPKAIHQLPELQEFSTDVKDWAKRLQGCQDEGMPWGKALEEVGILEW